MHDAWRTVVMHAGHTRRCRSHATPPPVTLRTVTVNTTPTKLATSESDAHALLRLEH